MTNRNDVTTNSEVFIVEVVTLEKLIFCVKFCYF